MLGVLNRIIASARIQNKTPTLQDAKLFKRSFEQYAISNKY